ncbi:MAG TPA: radical SAM protein, partial [Terriglobia bacterium]|nr:radical SAM protein [Terriglobia bacterium]
MSATQDPPVRRVDVSLQDMLMGPEPQWKKPIKDLEDGEGLPEPPYPARPGVSFEAGRSYHNMKLVRQVKTLGIPYLKSRVMPGELHPLIAYLFTEWKCNLDCHYCWSFDNSVKGMSEAVAKRSIDWLHSLGCRFLALMGGEVLLRPKFVHKVMHYAAIQKGFQVYLPTNGRLMKPDVIDRLGDAGLGTVNLAVDCVDEKPGLPKALAPIRPYFEHLIKKTRTYGYTVFFNTCITRSNMDDVRQLTEIAHDNNIAIDYHIVETPMLEQSHFTRLNDNPTYLRPEDKPRVVELIDWILEKKRQGYKVVNQTERIEQMKDFVQGKLEPWGCRAGQSTLIIRTDGTLAPCFPMYSANYDWGVVEHPKFDNRQLSEM